MRRVFICNTYMQLLLSIQIVRKFQVDGCSDVILSDHSINAKMVKDQLSKEALFDHVFYVNSRQVIDRQGLKAYYRYIMFNIGSFNKTFNKMLNDTQLEELYYDDLYGFNRDAFYYSMYFAIEKQYKRPNINIIEEGPFSYELMINPYISGSLKSVVTLRAIQNNDKKIWMVNHFYCFFKVFFSEKNIKNCVEVPLFKRNDDELIRILTNIFDYQHVDLPRYIYFGGNPDIEEYNMIEQDYVKHIANIVGEENLIIKKHPRDTSDAYKKMGIREYKNSFIPWEVMSLIEDFSEHVFLTMYSSSILSSAAITGTSTKGYYLYPLIKGKIKSLDEDIVNVFKIEERVKRFHKAGFCKGIKIINSLDELSLSLERL